MHADVATALQSLVGHEYCYTGDAAAAYAIDGVLPAIVVCPEDEAQVAAVMQLAHEHRATVFPRGGGSHIGLGHPPARVDVVLSLQRLQQQLAYEPADMTTTVQAGLRLADLQQTLSHNGQRLTLDPPALATTTVGGIVATNMSGPRRLLYGTARDLLLGIAVITVDGRRTKAGARVVKNVTGYDLNKLYIGSLGTLAVIVELTFKLHPLPPGEYTLGLGFSHHADMLPLLQTLRELPLRLNSLELLNAAAVATMHTRTGLSTPDTAYLLLVRLEGAPEVVSRQEQRLLTALQSLPLRGPLVPHSWSDVEQVCLWREIEEFPVAMHTQAPQGVVSKVSVLMAQLPALFQHLEAANTAWPILAHAGDGIAYVHFPPDDTAGAEPLQLLPHLRALDDCVHRLGGYRVLERAPVALKRQCAIWEPPANGFTLMRAIKTSFDPDHRLNPGRFIGGL
jgi:glycolate dehydrogenase FAD-binding subunit